MDENVVNKIVNTLNGWKTIIGAVGTPIASAVIMLTPDNTVAHWIAIGFTALFGSTGIVGVIHKDIKNQLPGQINAAPSGTLPIK
jgi:hypothetical protein